MEQIFGPLPANHVPHHIVPSTSPAMQRLTDFGIDPNSVSNGVALPKPGAGQMAAAHSGRPGAIRSRQRPAATKRVTADPGVRLLGELMENTH